MTSSSSETQPKRRGLLGWFASLLGTERSLENPTTTLADPAPWLSEAWGGGESTSGVSVNSNTVFHYAADRKKAAGRALGTLVEIVLAPSI